jgi:hypothetical protein
MDNDDLIITINDKTLTIDSHTFEVVNVGDITLSTDGMQVYGNHDWISIGDLTTDTIDLNSIIITQPVEFEDEMPSVAKIEDMCNDYPALEKAYENFKTIYKMVHQDWQGKQDAEK